MTSAFDQRIARLGIEINGEFLNLEGLDIRASGIKYFSPSSSQCTVRISNLTKEHRNYIVTKASPIIFSNASRQAINMTLDVGRESYGTFRLFQGGVLAMNVTQPPDIGIILESLTNNYAISLINMNSYGPTVSFRTLAQKVADQNRLALNFRARNINVENYSFTGALAKQMEKLQQIGAVNVASDGETLTVLDTDQFIDEGNILLNLDTGMVGVPQPCEQGVIVKTLIFGSIKQGSKVTIDSQINPAVNGEYKVMQIHFDVANRDTPFFYTLVCSNRPQDQGVVNG